MIKWLVKYNSDIQKNILINSNTMEDKIKNKIKNRGSSSDSEKFIDLMKVTNNKPNEKGLG